MNTIRKIQIAFVLLSLFTLMVSFPLNSIQVMNGSSPARPRYAPVPPSLSSPPSLSERSQSKAVAEQAQLSFVPNVGQMDANVLFQAQSNKVDYSFTSEAVIITLPATPHIKLELYFEAAQPAPQITGTDLLPGKINYYLGNDPSQWYLGVQTFSGITYQDLNPGIDLHYEGSGQNLKATYEVAPGADPAQIHWRYTCDTSCKKEEMVRLHVDEMSGDLLISLLIAGKQRLELREQAPVAWQLKAGQRQPVRVNFELGRDGTVGFSLPDGYDHNQVLTIDPVIVYSSYLGGSGDDYGLGIALDLSGAVFVTGYTNSQDFPMLNPFQDFHTMSDYVAFVTKFDPQGALIYSTYLGCVQGSYYENRGYGIAIDLLGYAYVTGYTSNPHFPTTAGAYQMALAGGNDVYVTKFDPGGILVYSTYLGGKGSEYGMAIGVDFWGNAYITGGTQSSDFPTVTGGNFQNRLGGSEDAFVTELNNTGTGLLYSTYLGGNGNDRGTGIVVDIFLGNAYITGYTNSTTGFPTFKAFQPNIGGQYDAFVTKLAPTGNQMIFSTFLGGQGNDNGDGIVIDASLNVYVTGNTSSTNFPTQSPIQASNGGLIDAFLSKLNSDGSALIFSTYLGGGGDDYGSGLGLDASGNVYLTGSTKSTNFPIVKPLQATNHGKEDAFVAALYTNGSGVIYSTYLGGQEVDAGLSMAVDGNGVAYISGITSGNNFPVSQGSYAGGAIDAFVVKLGLSPHVYLPMIIH